MIQKTGYQPRFGYQAITNLLIKKGFEIITNNKSNTTNSYYLVAQLGNTMFDIRLSDHSEWDVDEADYIEDVSTENIRGEEIRFIDIRIASKNGYQDAIELIRNF